MARDGPRGSAAGQQQWAYLSSIKYNLGTSKLSNCLSGIFARYFSVPQLRCSTLMDDGRACEAWTADGGSSPTVNPPAPEDFTVALFASSDEEVLAVTNCSSRRSRIQTGVILAAISSLS